MSALGKALRVHGEEVDKVEALYLETAGECTEATAEAEEARTMATDVVLVELARYRAWVGDEKRAIAAEFERLARLAAEFEKRTKWVDEMLIGVVRARDPAVKSRRAGTFMVKLRDTQRVDAHADLDLAQLPPHWRRVVAAVPAKPAGLALDKVAAKRDLRAGWRTGAPPGPGWYETNPPGRPRRLMYLWKGLISGQWLYAWELTNGRPPAGRLPEGADLASLGLSLTPEPGLDLLEWRHHAPGVTLASRVSVAIV